MPQGHERGRVVFRRSEQRLRPSRGNVAQEWAPERAARQSAAAPDAQACAERKLIAVEPGEGRWMSKSALARVDGMKAAETTAETERLLTNGSGPVSALG
jgi:hypothetical protein